MATGGSAAFASSWKSQSAAVDRHGPVLETTRSLAPLVRVAHLGGQAYMDMWIQELGRAADSEASLEALGVAVRDIERTDGSDLSKSLDDNLNRIQSIGERKGQMGKLLEELDLVDKTLTERLSVVGGSATELGTAVGNAEHVNSAYFDLTAIRVVEGVDPSPASTDAAAFIEGTNAGQSAGLKTVQSLESLLTEGLTDSPLKRDLVSIARSRSSQPLSRDLSWSTAQTQPEISHPSADELHQALRRVNNEVTTAIVAETERVQRRALADQRSDVATRNRTGLAAFALGLAALLSIAWLVFRLRKSFAELRRLAEFDPLTESLNRVGVRRVTEPWFADRGQTLIAVAVVDLDRFKSINDTFGHDGGDVVLRTVTGRLQSSTIPDTTAIARWGGDEFVGVFRFDRSLRSEDTDALFDRVHRATTPPIELGESVVLVTTTIGVATCSCGTCDFDDLFRAADHALYAGKFSGRNRWTRVDCSFNLASAALDLPVGRKLADHDIHLGI
jgi:diguanylate cyclase (GGDEF)-like protein